MEAQERPIVPLWFQRFTLSPLACRSHMRTRRESQKHHPLFAHWRPLSQQPIQTALLLCLSHQFRLTTPGPLEKTKNDASAVWQCLKPLKAQVPPCFCYQCVESGRAGFWWGMSLGDNPSVLSTIVGAEEFLQSSSGRCKLREQGFVPSRVLSRSVFRALWHTACREIYTALALRP